MKRKTYEMLMEIQNIFMEYVYEPFCIETENEIHNDVRKLLLKMFGDRIFNILEISINPVFDYNKCVYETLFIDMKTGDIISDINTLESLLYQEDNLKLNNTSYKCIE